MQAERRGAQNIDPRAVEYAGAYLNEVRARYEKAIGKSRHPRATRLSHDGSSFPTTVVRRGNSAVLIVRDANKQALAFVYCEDEPGRRATGKLLTHRQAAGPAEAVKAKAA